MTKLSFYYSAMNAGKTTALLQSSYNYRESGMNTLCFLPKVIADRIGENKIQSRIGIHSECVAFDSKFEFKKFIEKHIKILSLSCILIDEAQFLVKEQVWDLAGIVDEYDIPVLSYGLRTDFQGNLFSGSQHLLAWADELIEIKTICFCGKNAKMVVRLSPSGEVITEGDQLDQEGSRYISFCRKHYREITQKKRLDSSKMFCMIK